jgi:hypothetical protein
MKLSAAGKARWMVLAAAALAAAIPLLAQEPPQPLSPGQLDNLVSRIALYPDPLLAQVLTAATYFDQIPDAAAWADQHNYLQGEQLAQAIQEDNVPWDPSVQALLAFPSVLDQMERDMNWTRALGEAVLNSRADVMDAVQRMRHRAYQYGYLRDCPQYHVVVGGPWIEIDPIDAGMIFVPVYDPYWIFAPPRPGFAIGISFGARIFVGASFGGVGWLSPHFNWGAHALIIDNHPWERNAMNRATYAHPYHAPAMRRGPEARGTYHETHAVRPNRSDRSEHREGRR